VAPARCLVHCFRLSRRRKSLLYSRCHPHLAAQRPLPVLLQCLHRPPLRSQCRNFLRRAFHSAILAALRRSPRMKHLSFLLLAAACVLLPACAGYQLGGQKPTRLREIRTLAVPAFDNLTLEPRIAVNATNAAIKAIQNHGAYEIVPRDQADAVLKASVRNVHRTQFRSDRTNILRSSQMQVILDIQYSIEDRSGRVLYTNFVNGETQMLIDPNLQLSETQALEDAAQRAAIKLADDICEGW